MPFEIDGNFGGTAGLAEMLLQSHERDSDGRFILHVLPALPAAWPNGKVAGLRARGGVEVDIAWRDGKATKVELRATSNGTFRIRAPKGQQVDGPQVVDIEAGDVHQVRFR